ncbi:unnamed protein product, partial [Closterium sp. NIES-53]
GDLTYPPLDGGGPQCVCILGCSLALVCDPTTGTLSPRTICCVFRGIPTDAPDWQFYHPATRCILTSRKVTFDEPVCYYHLYPHRSSPPPCPFSWLQVSSDPSGPAEGGDPSADDIAASCRSSRLETPPRFLPWSSSPPLQPVGVEPGYVGGGVSRGAGSRVAGARGGDSVGAGSRGAGSGGVEGPRVGGVEGAAARGSTGALQLLPRRPLF